MESLSALLPEKTEREAALKAALYVLGPLKEATPAALDLLRRVAEALDLPAELEDVVENPLFMAALPPAPLPVAPISEV